MYMYVCLRVQGSASKTYLVKGITVDFSMFGVQDNPESSHEWATAHGGQTVEFIVTFGLYFKSNFESGK